MKTPPEDEGEPEGARLCRPTVNLERSEGFDFSLFVGGGADVGPGILVGDTRNSQDVDVLGALGGKFSLQLEGTEIRSPSVTDLPSDSSKTVRIVTLDHLISGTGYPDATQGKTASEPTVTSFLSGSAEI